MSAAYYTFLGITLYYLVNFLCGILAERLWESKCPEDFTQSDWGALMMISWLPLSPFIVAGLIWRDYIFPRLAKERSVKTKKSQ